MAESKTKTNPSRFLREVRQEVNKVTWPTRKETLVSTGMVLLLVLISAFFFWIVDSLINFAVKSIMGL